MKVLVLTLSILAASTLLADQKLPQTDGPLRIGIAGLTHTHVHGLLGRPDRGDIEIVGIVEPNRDLAERYARQHGYSMEIVHDDLEEMIRATSPEAVAAFGSIRQHLEVVEACAPHGIHVMVEKPLAVSLAHARKMKSLADKHQIQLLTNYETTWYPTNHRTFNEIYEQGSIGEIRKIVVHDGHQGPKEIGVNDEFLEWLTDPIENGGGAVMDFGCYGANLITWLMHGEPPTSVYAMTQQIKPDVYPNVDDEATIVLKYPKAQGIIQASWNWPFNRKDMHVYGQSGYIFSDNHESLRIRLKQDSSERQERVDALRTPLDDPFAFFAAVIRGEIEMSSSDLSSLANNMIVMEILEAAKKSARTGKVVTLESE